jgi:hypothetical protein
MRGQAPSRAARQPETVSPPPPSRVLQYCDRCLMADGDVMMADGDVMTRCMTVAGDALDGGPAS